MLSANEPDSFSTLDKALHSEIINSGLTQRDVLAIKLTSHANYKAFLGNEGKVISHRIEEFVYNINRHIKGIDQCNTDLRVSLQNLLGQLDKPINSDNFSSALKACLTELAKIKQGFSLSGLFFKTPLELIKDELGKLSVFLQQPRFKEITFTLPKLQDYSGCNEKPVKKQVFPDGIGIYCFFDAEGDLYNIAVDKSKLKKYRYDDKNECYTLIDTIRNPQFSDESFFERTGIYAGSASYLITMGMFTNNTNDDQQFVIAYKRLIKQDDIHIIYYDLKTFKKISNFPLSEIDNVSKDNLSHCQSISIFKNRYAILKITANPGERQILVLDLSKKKILFENICAKEYLQDITLTDKMELVACFASGEIKFWNIEKQKLERTLQCPVLPADKKDVDRGSSFVRGHTGKVMALPGDYLLCQIAIINSSHSPYTQNFPPLKNRIIDLKSGAVTDVTDKITHWFGETQRLFNHRLGHLIHRGDSPHEVEIISFLPLVFSNKNQPLPSVEQPDPLYRPARSFSSG